MELVLNSFNVTLPLKTPMDHAVFEGIAINLGKIWEKTIENHVYDPQNIVSIDPKRFVKTIPKMLTPTKLKLAEYLLQVGSKNLYKALEKSNIPVHEKLSLMKDIYDNSKIFLDKKKLTLFKKVSPQ
jgi:hypothetical protein